MPDTPENQKSYPQPSSQSPGCGFPIAKIGVLFSLTTGAAIALVIDVLNTHDIKRERRVYEFLNPGDVLLGSRAFCSYVDLVFVLYQQRLHELFDEIAPKFALFINLIAEWLTVLGRVMTRSVRSRARWRRPQRSRRRRRRGRI